MPVFSYKARRAGEEYKAQKEVKDKFELYRLIREEGGEVISVTETGSGGIDISKMMTAIFAKRGSVKMHEKITFARNLGSMLEAGLSISRALSVVERQAQNAQLKKTVNDIITDISQGKTFADALVRHMKVFSSLFISMVRAGEQSGTLAQSLKTLAQQMDRTYTLQRKVRGAMMYPSVIFAVMLIIGILMLTYIVPTLTSTFIELNVELPATTKFIIFISDILRHQGLWALLGAVVLGMVVYFWARTPGGKRILDLVWIKVPVIGEIVREVNTARTSRTLSSLLSSGVDVVESMKITSDVLQNFHYKKILEVTSEKIKKGEPMSEYIIQNSKFYPIFLGEMMSVGEETGKMSEMLHGVAVFYEDDVEQRTKDMSTVIEPVLMVVIGGAVGFFALSMISPMYSLSSAI